MRIVGGSARGRVIEGPKHAGVRPTADRVRETLFNILGQAFSGERVLDLYAGTGALALEALSRGASDAVLVDSDRGSAELCQKNADALGFSEQVEVMSTAVERAVVRLGAAKQVFDLIFADPPYALAAGVPVLNWVIQHGLLSESGTLVIEHDKREVLPPSLSTWTRSDERAFGDTRVSFYRFA